MLVAVLRQQQDKLVVQHVAREHTRPLVPVPVQIARRELITQTQVPRLVRIVRPILLRRLRLLRLAVIVLMVTSQMLVPVPVQKFKVKNRASRILMTQTTVPQRLHPVVL